MRPGWLIAVVFAACTSAEPRSEPPVVDTPVAVAEAPPPADSMHAASHWYWDVDTAIVDAKSIPEGWRVVGQGPLQLELMTRGVQTMRVEVPDSAHHDVGVVAVHGGAVYVAHHSGIASGTTLTRFAATDGRVVWSTPLHGIGPTDHSEYRNEVQLAIEDGNPVVFGHEAHGDYTEIVDAQTGKAIAHGQPPQVLTTLEWTFTDVEPDGFPKTVLIPTQAGDVVFQEAQAAGEVALAMLVHGHTRQWSVELPGNDFCGRAALHELFGTLWVVRFCAIASGAELVGIDMKTGDIRVTRRLRALPNIVHSRYAAAVQLRDVAGYLVVMGRESGGRYLEAIHPETGATVVSRTWR